MSTGNNIYIKKTHITDESIDELDIELREEFGFDYDDDNECIEIQDKYGNADGHSVRIDKMIEILQKLKNDGATHVDLSYHCDHIGYDISGYKIELADQATIDEYNSIREKRLENIRKANELRKQIIDLENENNA